MSVNEYYKGAEVGTLNAEKFAWQHIENGVLAEDSALMETKWFDYRTLHPTLATFYFASRFHKLAEEYLFRYVSEEDAKKYARRMASYDLRKQKLAIIRGFWRARMAADAIGCTYDVYIRAALAHFMENYHLYGTTKVRVKGKKQWLPYITQTYTEGVINKACAGWDAAIEKGVPIPEADILRETTPWFQADMEAWIHKQSRKHPVPENWVKKAMNTGAIKA